MVLSRFDCDGVRPGVFEATATVTALLSLALDDHLAARPQRGASASHSPGQSRRTAIYRDDQRAAAIRSHELARAGTRTDHAYSSPFALTLAQGSLDAALSSFHRHARRLCGVLPSLFPSSTEETEADLVGALDGACLRSCSVRLEG